MPSIYGNFSVRLSARFTPKPGPSIDIEPDFIKNESCPNYGSIQKVSDCSSKNSQTTNYFNKFYPQEKWRPIFKNRRLWVFNVVLIIFIITVLSMLLSESSEFSILNN